MSSPALKGMAGPEGGGEVPNRLISMLREGIGKFAAEIWSEVLRYDRVSVRAILYETFYVNGRIRSEIQQA